MAAMFCPGTLGSLEDDEICKLESIDEPDCPSEEPGGVNEEVGITTKPGILTEQLLCVSVEPLSLELVLSVESSWIETST